MGLSTLPESLSAELGEDRLERSVDFPITGPGPCYLELAPDISAAPSRCLEPLGTQDWVPTHQDKSRQARCDIVERGSEQLLGGGGALRGL